MYTGEHLWYLQPSAGHMCSHLGQRDVAVVVALPQGSQDTSVTVDLEDLPYIAIDSIGGGTLLMIACLEKHCLRFGSIYLVGRSTRLSILHI